MRCLLQWMIDVDIPDISIAFSFCHKGSSERGLLAALQACGCCGYKRALLMLQDDCLYPSDNAIRKRGLSLNLKVVLLSQATHNFLIFVPFVEYIIMGVADMH